MEKNQCRLNRRLIIKIQKKVMNKNDDKSRFNPKKEELIHEKPPYGYIYKVIKKEKWKDPKYRENVMKALSKPEVKKKQRQAMMERWKDLKFRKQFEKKITNRKEFLIDIKEGIPIKEMEKKYKMSHPTINKNIEQIFRPNGPKNYSEAKKYLKDKNNAFISRNFKKSEKQKD